MQIRFKEDKYGLLSKRQVAATDIERVRAAGVADLIGSGSRCRRAAALQLMTSWRIFAIVIATVLAFGIPLHASSGYESGKKAWEAGQLSEALEYWTVAAETGDRRSMLEMGRLYLQGLGVSQDYVLSHMWFNLAAARGEMEALSEREAVAEKMTSQQLAEAQERAREWQPGKDKPEPEVTVQSGGAETESGMEFQDCDICPVMVAVPPGTFLMGSPASEEGGDDYEVPQHPVTISYPFAVGKYEVTREQFEKFVEATGYDASSSGCWTYREDDRWEIRQQDSWRTPGFSQDNDHPVVCISWHDAQAYVSWLSGKTGEQYRLLSESEWEYVARAGTTGPFHFGSTISTDQANYNGNFTYGGGPVGIDRGETVSVGSFPANRFGLYDVHGNVEEWVEDCWHGDYHGAPSNGSDGDYHGAPSDGSVWVTGVECGRRVLRGGSWFDFPWYMRSANRNWYEAWNRDSRNGFRVARTLTP